MLSALSAESLKLRSHRSTWLLVWIYPIAVTVILLIALTYQLSRGGPPAPAAPELQPWLRNAADFWGATSTNLPRFLTCALVALAFAGEYRWNTWKLIVPHRSRVSLIAAKYLVTLGLLYAAFLAAALIYNGLWWLEQALSGDPLPQGITLGGLVQAHWTKFLASLPTVLYTVAMASFAAILFRSTAAAMIVAIVLITLETAFTAFAPMISVYLPGITEFLFQLLPGYHLANLADWASVGRAESVAFPSGERIAYGWAASTAVIFAWIGGFVALTFWRFQKQDIN